jgi:hypothetical protein
MEQVIIFKNLNDTNVCVCVPTGELSIEEVLAKDCPEGAIIVNKSILPTGNDDIYFDAWVLNNDNTISINIARAQLEHTKQFNIFAAKSHQIRLSNTAIGLSNSTDDTTWTNNIVAMRNAIANTTTTSELVAIGYPNP